MAFFEFPHTRTYDSDLGWLIKDYQQLTEAYQTLVDGQSALEDRIKAVETFQNAINAGILPEALQTSIIKWLDANAVDIIGSKINNVFFGLTDAGYFTAFIPESWKEIKFNTTGYDIIIATQPDYGHLTLSY